MPTRRNFLKGSAAAAASAALPAMGLSYRQSDYADNIVAESLREFAQLQLWRNTTAGHWEEIAQLILPTSRNTFFYGNVNWPGEKKTDKQVDASGMMALHRFAAICDSLLTPRNQIWHMLEADDPYVMKDRATRLWFQDVTRTLFKYRYAPQANFASQNQNNFQSLGAFGTATMWADSFEGPERGIRYRALPLGETFLKENHQGLINGMCRWFRLTGEQAMLFSPEWAAKMPEGIRQAAILNSQQKFDFLHRVCERHEWDPQRFDYKGMRYASYYIAIQGKILLSEGGYTSFPAASSRYDQTPNEIYGRSPAMMVLPALKTLNAEKKVFLKQGHRAADPVLLMEDDGIVDFNLRPGSENKGGWRDGKPTIGTLPAGDIAITEKMMLEEKGLINDAFLVTLFQILTETPQMTATEVIERTNEKGILLAPTVGRQQSEYLGPLIHRELDLLAFQRLLPPMPGRLREAQGAYSVRYTSPLSRAQRAQEAAGFMRTIESVRELAAITQDPSLLDRFNFDVAIPEIADIQAVPESWMCSDDEVSAKRQARAQATKAQQQIQAAPAQAALMKAQAAQMKAGMGNQGGPQAPQQQQRQPEQMAA